MTNLTKYEGTRLDGSKYGKEISTHGNFYDFRNKSYSELRKNVVADYENGKFKGQKSVMIRGVYFTKIMGVETNTDFNLPIENFIFTDAGTKRVYSKEL